MNTTNKYIIEILKSSFLENKYVVSKQCDWNEILDKSNSHQIIPLIYNSLDRSNFQCIDKEILDKWKHDVLQLNMRQMFKVKALKKILHDLINRNVEIIVLKGIILRNYYPKPELRTMGDFDILIHDKDLLNVQEYLLGNGFKLKDDNHPVHAEFINEKGIRIEVHWKLINNNTYVFNTENFEKYIWNDLIDFDFYGVKVKSLGREDFLLHLCIHMAKHLRNSGFGLRQLYDVAAFIKAEDKNINWLEFERKVKECGALKFSITLFKLINDIFELNLCKDLILKYQVSNDDVNLLIQDILSYDAFNDSERKIFLKKNLFSGKKILNVIFPTSGDLNRKYSYAKENSFLLPIAWIHRGFIWIIKNIADKISRKNYKNKNLINRRKLLLNRFDL